MPHSQPLDTRLHDGALAVALGNRQVYSAPDADHPLSSGLAIGDEATVFGEPAIGGGKRWWRIRKAGEAGFAWTVECDHDRYYLEPAGAPSETMTIYVVKAGDSWSKIAAKFRTTVQAIKRANPGLVRQGDVIDPGDRVRIPN